MPNDTTPSPDVELFYDGDCPLCRREIQLLRRWDRQRRIRFVDIAHPDFEGRDGKSYDDLMARIHARLSDGRWITGVEAFRQVYGALGRSWLVALSRWPGIRQLLDRGYAFFARNRLRWTGRGRFCTRSSQCSPQHGGPSPQSKRS